MNIKDKGIAFDNVITHHFRFLDCIYQCLTISAKDSIDDVIYD